jgi:OPA family sugar phosphate sensor protein UhpC-like MFS transporter
MGFWSTSYLVGNMTVKSLGALLLAWYGWRYSFWGLTLLTVGVWLLVYIWQRNRPEDVGLEPIVNKRAEDNRAVRASEETHISTAHYFRLAFNPVVLTMGISYFCIKFLRYALDSWLPAFLNIQGLDVGRAGFYSSIFDWTGLGGAIIAGWALDRVFRGNWAMLCFTMGLGMILGYLAVIYAGTNPLMIALCFGIVGFMIYGPDTILCGAASVTVAGERNGVAVAGLVNGIASIGPVIQEQVIGWLVSGDEMTGIRNTNRLALSMSIVFVLLMIVMMWRLHITHKGHRERDELALLKAEVAEASGSE